MEPVAEPPADPFADPVADPVADPAVESALCAVQTAIDHLVRSGCAPVDGRDAYALARRLERIGRQVASVQVGLVAEVDRRGLHREDGHRSAKALIGFAANLSGASAARRGAAARSLRDLPAVAAALAAGGLGMDQVDRIARVYANPRVREQLVDAQAHLAVVAAQLPYREFDLLLGQWERLADEDGAADRAERDHRRRSFSIRRNLDGSYRIEGGCGALQGTVTADIFEHYLRAEVEADWAEARARVGDDATTEDLARTDAQRCMDAAERIFLDAAGSVAQRTGHHIVTNLVVDQETFERAARRATGDDPDPDPRLDTWWSDLAGTCTEPATDGEPADDAGSAIGHRSHHRCTTLDGHPMDPTEVMAAALVGHVRRVVLGSDSVVVDMGRRRRLFTGPRQLAVFLSGPTCYWPGCHLPVTACQGDHLEPWSTGTASTSPGNGGPACGKHNRHRNHGFTVRRDTSGRLHVHRPDGSEIV